MECNKLSQFVTECRCLIHEIFKNAEAETMECSEIIIGSKKKKKKCALCFR